MTKIIQIEYACVYWSPILTFQNALTHAQFYLLQQQEMDWQTFLRILPRIYLKETCSLLKELKKIEKKIK